MAEQDSSLTFAAVPEGDPELQFRAMADFMPHLVWFTDQHGGTIWYNRRWYEFTGSDPEQMAGWGWAKAVHPDHADRVVEGFRRAWEAGADWEDRSEEHTSELQSLMRISYAVFCLKKKNDIKKKIK